MSPSPSGVPLWITLITQISLFLSVKISKNFKRIDFCDYFIEHIFINLGLMSKTWSILEIHIGLYTVKVKRVSSKSPNIEMRLASSCCIWPSHTPRCCHICQIEVFSYFLPLTAPFINFSSVWLQHPIEMDSVFWQSATLTSTSLKISDLQQPWLSPCILDLTGRGNLRDRMFVVWLS